MGRRVSPAPAGIDPEHERLRLLLARLPRTRGDRPRQAAEDLAQRASPPHPRGSTRSAQTARYQALVSPAPAGIDHARPFLTCGTARLPRTRGDRPLPEPRDDVYVPSPPHPRGSTPLCQRSIRAPCVSPAPAGIDRSAWQTSPSSRSLPRTRGDRPRRRRWPARRRWSPPHPRGSTQSRDGRRARKRVSPAPAGIDLHPEGPLPGTRASPPHPRGSTSPEHSRA